AIALGEADETWPRIVNDAVNGRLKDVYEPVDAFGQEQKPKLEAYPQIPWESLDLKQFNRIPKFLAPVFRRFGIKWENFHLIPIESGRGCPYGCEFCTVTGFFGDSIRFRTNQSVVEELLRLKARASRSRGKVAVFFVDDNFAINIKRTKSLLRDIIAAGAQVSWVGQISANLLRDEELVDLIAESGGKWIFIGMESLDPVNLKDVNKGFNKPSEYAAVLERLARRNVYAITSFIFGLDNDTVGVADRTLGQIRDWPPGLPVFGQITPFPSTPLYDRLAKEGRLTRPTHWLDFAPFKMAHTPLKMSVGEVHTEVDQAWTDSYAPEATKRAMRKIADAPVPYKISHLIARLCFRGIYFPQKGTLAWVKVLVENRRPIFQIVVESFTKWRGSTAAGVELDFNRGVKRA
ncbi:MAG TPA: radical SAM protein, partial [Bryobacteraceae bacterium]|nr:radical SAM protein [Bryobacteraceae bacterium]